VHHIRLLVAAHHRLLLAFAVVLAACVPGGFLAARYVGENGPGESGAAAVVAAPVVTALPTPPGYDDVPPGEYFCFGYGLPELRIRISPDHVVSGGGDAEQWTLYWPPGFTVQERDGRLAVIADNGKLVARDGTVLENVGVCPGSPEPNPGMYFVHDLVGVFP
jgi:hypothetical protein